MLLWYICIHSFHEVLLIYKCITHVYIYKYMYICVCVSNQLLLGVFCCLYYPWRFLNCQVELSLSMNNRGIYHSTLFFYWIFISVVTFACECTFPKCSAHVSFASKSQESIMLIYIYIYMQDNLFMYIYLYGHIYWQMKAINTMLQTKFL